MHGGLQARIQPSHPSLDPEAVETQASVGAPSTSLGAGNSAPARVVTSDPWSRLCRDRRRMRPPAPPGADQRRRPGRRIQAVRLPPRLGSQPARLGHQLLLGCGRRGRRPERRARAVPAPRRPRPPAPRHRPGARGGVPRSGRLRRFRDSRERRRRQDDARAARHRHLSGVPRRVVRPRQPASPLSVHELHELRASLLDHRGAAVRSADDHDGRVRDVRGLPGRVPRTRATADSTRSPTPAPPADRSSPSGTPTAGRWPIETMRCGRQGAASRAARLSP